MTIETEIKAAVERAVEPITKELRSLREMLEEKKPLIGTKEKARLLGVTEETVRRRVRCGDLKCAERNGTRMMFHA